MHLTPARTGLSKRCNSSKVEFVDIRPFKTIKPALAKCVNDSQDDWDQLVPFAISAYNDSNHSTIKMSPFEAIFHVKPVLVADVILNRQLTANTKLNDVSQYIFGLRRAASVVNKMIKQQTELAQIKQKRNYDRFVKDKVQYKVGDQVSITNFRCRPGHSKSFEQKFIGPYTITRLLGEVNYEIHSPQLGTERVHYNRLKQFHVRNSIAQEPPILNKPKPSSSIELVQNESSFVRFNLALILQARSRASIAADLLNVEDDVDDEPESEHQIEDEYLVENEDDNIDEDNNESQDETATRDETTYDPNRTNTLAELNQSIAEVLAGTANLVVDPGLDLILANPLIAGQTRCYLCGVAYTGINKHITSCLKKPERHLPGVIVPITEQTVVARNNANVRTRVQTVFYQAGQDDAEQ